MDFSKYSGETISLITKVLETAQNPNSHVFASLRKLEKISKDSKDDELLGFVYYNYALAYISREKHKEFMEHLKIAIRHLLRVDDKELLARAYNLFAIEAKTNGCFEVALDYYYTAHSLVAEDEDSIAYALTTANIGDLLSQMGDYKNAYERIKKALAIIAADEEEPVSRKNTAIIHINLGIAALNDHKMSDALKEAKYFEAMGMDAIKEMGEETELFYLIFRLRLAIAKGESSQIKALTREVEVRIVESTVLSEFVKEILDIFAELIRVGELKIAHRLLVALDKRTKMNFFAKMLFSQLKITYYTASGDRKKRMKCYGERDEFLRSQEKIQNTIFHESIELMELLEDLRRDEEQIRSDIIAIQRDAETDSLTGLPNRHALDKRLDMAFSEAKEKQISLGIGVADIDSFKKYNDNFGHLMGDQCLIDVGAALRQVAENHGLFVSRYGGDEFIFIYMGLDNKEIRAIEKEIIKTCPVSITHGFYNAVPKYNSKIFDYMAKADHKLYKNKEKSGAWLVWS